jgi:hypothetical protein
MVCDGQVAVRKDAAGAVTIEGPLSETYYRVRKVLYEQFAIV